MKLDNFMINFKSTLTKRIIILGNPHKDELIVHNKT
jgi:hypothetical protein